MLISECYLFLFLASKKARTIYLCIFMFLLPFASNSIKFILHGWIKTKHYGESTKPCQSVTLNDTCFVVLFVCTVHVCIMTTNIRHAHITGDLMHWSITAIATDSIWQMSSLIKYDSLQPTCRVVGWKKIQVPQRRPQTDCRAMINNEH